MPSVPSVKKQTAFRIDPEVMNALQFIKERDGVLVSEQVRRALLLWLKAKGVPVTPAATRTVSPKPARRQGRAK